MFTGRSASFPFDTASGCCLRSDDAGYLSVVGTSSCCSVPSCPMGCAIGQVVSSVAACKAQCAAASDCSYTIPNTTLTLSTCSSCVNGCPGSKDCDAGCALYFSGDSPQAWKAVLPPQTSGGDFVVTATCSNCLASANPVRSLHHVSFGSVFYCSGQSNMASSFVARGLTLRALHHLARCGCRRSECSTRSDTMMLWQKSKQGCSTTFVSFVRLRDAPPALCSHLLPSSARVYCRIRRHGCAECCLVSNLCNDGPYVFVIWAVPVFHATLSQWPLFGCRPLLAMAKSIRSPRRSRLCKLPGLWQRSRNVLLLCACAQEGGGLWPVWFYFQRRRRHDYRCLVRLVCTCSVFGRFIRLDCRSATRPVQRHGSTFDQHDVFRHALVPGWVGKVQAPSP